MRRAGLLYAMLLVASCARRPIVAEVRIRSAWGWTPDSRVWSNPLAVRRTRTGYELDGRPIPDSEIEYLAYVMYSKPLARIDFRNLGIDDRWIANTAQRGVAQMEHEFRIRLREEQRLRVLASFHVPKAFESALYTAFASGRIDD